jgi:hypothetical protein
MSSSTAEKHDKQLVLQVATIGTTSILITEVSGKQISLEYSTITGNHPPKNGNTVYLWQAGDNTIPWSQEAKFSQAITVDKPQGDISFDDLEIGRQSYVIGYAVGPLVTTPPFSAYANVVASAYEYGSPTIATKRIGSNSLTLDYTFLNGFNAASAGACCGMWEGPTTSWTAQPKWRTQIKDPSNAGVATFNGVSLLRGVTYSVGLYPTGWVATGNLPLTRLCSFVTFKV